MSAELMVHELAREVAELRASMGGGHNAPAWADIRSVEDKAASKVKALSDEVQALKTQLTVLGSRIEAKASPGFVQDQNRIWGESMATATRQVLDVERKDMEQRLAATAGAAAESARAASAIARVDLDRAVDTVRAASFHFAHGE